MKLAPGTPIKYNGFTGQLWHKPDARYDKRTGSHRPPYEAYWFVPDFDHAASGFWVRVDDPVIVVLKLPIMGPWCDTDVWVDVRGVGLTKMSCDSYSRLRRTTKTWWTAGDLNPSGMDSYSLPGTVRRPAKWGRSR